MWKLLNTLIMCVCGIYLTVVGIPDAGGLHVVSLDENVQPAVITQLHFAWPTTHLDWERGSVAVEANPVCHIHPLLKKQCRMCTSDTLFAICLEAHLLQTKSNHQKSTGKKKVILSKQEINITKQPHPK